MTKASHPFVLAILAGFVQCFASAMPAGEPAVAKEPFGKTRRGESVALFTLKNSSGSIAKVITYGAIIYSLEVPDRGGKLANVTANRETLADYETKSAAFGAVVGRFANRIANARFPLDEKVVEVTRNAGQHHIHGGVRGFDKVVWQAEPIEGPDFAGLRLTYLSKDGEEGYPGNLRCTIYYELNDRNEWKMDYTATTDQSTVVNLSNHAYWNLAGAYSGTMLSHELTLNADKYLLVDESLIPTGEYASVSGTPLDFRNPHSVGSRMQQISGKQFNGGYDHCLVINHRHPGDLTFAARLHDPSSGRTMEVLTTEPGVQIYSANFASGAFEGPNGYSYPRHLGLCLETQHFPDSPNKANFPSTVLRPAETFRSTTVHKFQNK
jgi:aldose 1-epimerase